MGSTIRRSYMGRV